MASSSLRNLLLKFESNLCDIVCHAINQKSIFYSINDFASDFIDSYKQFNEQKLGNDKIIFMLPPANEREDMRSYIASLIPLLQNCNVVLNNYYMHIASKIDMRLVNNIDINYMSKYYIQHIKLLQPKGHYYLFGWSTGGVIAFEIARQLERFYEDKIGYLGLLDSLFALQVLYQINMV